MFTIKKQYNLMINKISNLINAYSTIGAEEDTSAYELKKIKLLQIFCSVSYLVFISNFIERYFFTKNEQSLAIKVFVCLIITIISVQLLQYFKKHFLARILYIFFLFSVPFVFSNFLYPGQLLEYYIVLTPGVALIFLENKKVIFATLIISILALIFPNLYFKHYPISVFNSVNPPVLTISVYVMVSYFKKLNFKNEKALEERRQELQDLNDFQSQFFINISHEIRTPLTLIKGDINRLENHENELPSIKLIKQGLDKEINKINSIINDVLNLSRIEPSNFKLNIKTISATELIQKLYISFETLFNQKNIDFNLDPILNNVLIKADIIYLERAIGNILLNASKYTEQGGKVTLSLTVQNDIIGISIKDTGIGIPIREIHKICNQFYQVKNHINNSGGSGIGLSFTKEIVNLHQGILQIESEVNIGSHFKVILPLKEMQHLDTLNTTNLIIENTTELSLNTSKNKEEVILIVDDNSKMRNYIARLVYKQGYICIQAENGTEALNILESSKVDFIITDYMMPKMDGFDFVKHLKKNKIDLPVLMLTARHDNESRLKVFRLGIDDFLTKPFENNELIVRIENALKNYKQRVQFINQENISTEEIEDTKNWIDLVENFISENCSSFEFKQNDIAENFNMSESTLYRKIKAVRGMTPNKLITEIKLQKARKIIEHTTDVSLKQLALEVGFQHTSYFSKIYQTRFGNKPIEK